MSKFIVRVSGVDNWSSWIDSLPDKALDAVKKQVGKSAYRVESDAKWNCPVDTGRLEGSINTEMNMMLKGLSASIGTNVEYAEAVEYGTSKQYPQPYLFPAYRKELAKFNKEMQKIADGVSRL